jgi:hypothetical protein
VDPYACERAIACALAQLGRCNVPQTAETVSAVDRMLALRRVALFSQLAPEDLQRVAATAIERFYLPARRSSGKAKLATS